LQMSDRLGKQRVLGCFFFFQLNLLCFICFCTKSHYAA